MPKPKSFYRQTEGSHHCFCLICFRTVGASVDKLALRTLERAHTCDPRDLRTIQGVKVDAVRKKAVRA
jgi:hypothetical protein